MEEVEVEATVVADAVVVTEVEIIKLLRHRTPRMGDRDIRATSTLTSHRGCGLGVLCISNGGAKVTFVLNLKRVRGKM